MKISDAILISIDDHVIEPPGMFERHLPAVYRDRAPEVEQIDGLDRWIFLDTQTGSVGLDAVASWALRLIDRIGEDVVAWECDYPHSDSTWPESPELVIDECARAGLADSTIGKITWENAARFFRFDLFEHTSRQEATVGSLRSLARDVDKSTTAKAEYRRRYETVRSSGG